MNPDVTQALRPVVWRCFPIECAQTPNNYSYTYCSVVIISELIRWLKWANQTYKNQKSYQVSSFTNNFKGTSNHEHRQSKGKSGTANAALLVLSCHIKMNISPDLTYKVSKQCMQSSLTEKRNTLVMVCLHFTLWLLYSLYFSGSHAPQIHVFQVCLPHTIADKPSTSSYKHSIVKDSPTS